MTDQLKVLLLDLELSYAMAYIFPSKKPQYISPKNIKHHQFVVCAAYKWLHEVSTYVVKIKNAKSRNDKNIAVKLHELMTEADIIVAHNGDRFDIKHCNTMFITHGLGPIPERKSIDTLKMARKYFAFAGNDLDSLSKRFGGKGKATKPCWFKLTDGVASEVDIAAEYCKGDIIELERVFIAIRPFIRKLPHLGTLKDITECHACGSKRLVKKGKEFDGHRLYKRVKCKECGHEHKGKL